MPSLKSLTSCVVAAAAAVAASSSAQAQISGDTIKIGFITDLSGVYADTDGPGGVEAIRLAIEDMDGAINGKKIELLVADHQNKADVAAAKAREWVDREGVDMLIGGTNSGAVLAMAKLALEKKRPLIVVGAASTALTNEQCNPYTIHYAYDTYALAKGTGSAVVRAGGKSWFFLTADYTFGHLLQSDTSNVVKVSGGTVLGAARVPLNASDFSSFLLQAQASKAQILGLANAGGDTINAIKSASEFGITKSMKLAGLLLTINEIHALGLKQTQGMYLTDSWYWNRDADSRTWARRFFGKLKRMPSSIQAADYSAMLTFLKAVKATGTDDAEAVLAHMRKTKINDMYAKGGVIRPDGRMVHDMYLMQVKAPAQSTEPWDYFNVVETIAGDAAFIPKAESKCALWK